MLEHDSSVQNIHIHSFTLRWDLSDTVQIPKVSGTTLRAGSISDPFFLDIYHFRKVVYLLKRVIGQVHYDGFHRHFNVAVHLTAI
jgi:hypothetical protein